MLMPVKSCFY